MNGKGTTSLSQPGKETRTGQKDAVEAAFADRLERIEAAIAELRSQVRELSAKVDAAIPPGRPPAQKRRPSDLDFILGKERGLRGQRGRG
jgi:hypothetical protein